MHKFITLCSVLVASATTFASPVRDALAAKSFAFTDSAAPIPYDAEVEWLQGDGRGAYINTGVSLYDGDVNTEFSFPVNMTSAGGFGYNAYGGWNGDEVSGLTAGFGCFMYAGNICLRVGNGSWVRWIPYDSEAHTILTIDRRIFFDGEDTGRNGKVATISSTGEVVAPIFLFCEKQCQRNTVGQLFSSVRIYSFSCGDAIDLIPVRFTNEEGLTEGAMYDRVSGELFRNAGSGSFIIGPDKE